MNDSSKGMKIVFVGRRNNFNTGIIKWLEENFTLCAAFFIEEDRFSLPARATKIWKRVQKLGVIRVLDELLFHTFFRLRYGRTEKQLWSRQMPEQFTTPFYVNVPCYSCDDIHANRWLEKIKQIEPDIVFSVCTHTFFKPKLFNIPRFGMFILHEGITPEYRGLHTVAWALLHGQPEYIGYTLLKIDQGIDSGPILCQGVYPDADKFGFCWSFVGHSALIHGLPTMKASLSKLYLANGVFPAVPQEGRASKNYSWVRFSAYAHLRGASMLANKALR